MSIERWQDGDLRLLERLLGDPVMMAHLGGPFAPADIAARHERYRGDPHQFHILDRAGAPVGWVGFWERDWHGPVREIGWSVVPEAQGQGLASGATRAALTEAARVPGPRHVHAFPNVDNAPSNGVCSRCGFALLGPVDFEYPPGHTMRCNDWRYDLEG